MAGSDRWASVPKSSWQSALAQQLGFLRFLIRVHREAGCPVPKELHKMLALWRQAVGFFKPTTDERRAILRRSRWLREENT